MTNTRKFFLVSGWNVGIIILVVIILRVFLFMIYRVSGNSMNNTLFDGDRLLVIKRHDAKRNDVVVFDHGNQVLVKRIEGLPGDTLLIRKGKLYINRISIIIPSSINMRRRGWDIHDDMVKDRFGANWSLEDFGPVVVPRKGMRVSASSSLNNPYASLVKSELDEQQLRRDSLSRTDEGSYIIKKDYVFFLGDNRSQSDDSRVIGFVPQDHIIGVGKMVLYSRNRGLSMFVVLK